MPHRVVAHADLAHAAFFVAQASVRAHRAQRLRPAEAVDIAAVPVRTRDAIRISLTAIEATVGDAPIHAEHYVAGHEGWAIELRGAVREPVLAFLVAAETRET